MSTKIPVGLVGVTGYTGMELLRLLTGHPLFELVCATSRKEEGKPLASLFPHLQSFDLGNISVCTPDAGHIADVCKLVFLAVPHGTAMEIGAQCVSKGVKVVDLSADFRLKDSEIYEQWYSLPHTRKKLLQEAVYGLPELYKQQIADASLTANPGCYPTSAILGLAPVLSHGLVATEDIVIDSKSGTSGAGRSASVGTLFCEVHDNFRAYNLTKHRHTPEIEQELSLLTNGPMTVSFNTHLLPIDRGILSTMYTKLNEPMELEKIHSLYESYYAAHPWVRVLPRETLPQTRWVKGTMYCDIGLAVDPRTRRLIIVSAIDNLNRGASGQAMANANLMMKLDMGTGLSHFPMVP